MKKLPQNAVPEKQGKKKDVPYTEWFIWIAALLPLAATAVLYPWLPNRVPLHWNLAGEIDNWGERWQAFLIPALAFGSALLLRCSPAFDPKRENYKRFSGAYKAFRMAMALFFAVMTGVTLYASFEPDGVHVDMIIIACVGMLFCVIGNFMPKIKHNYLFGIRTPWTLAREDVWYATHRMAGPVWLAGGLVVTLCAFLPVSGTAKFMIVMTVTVLLTLVPVAYSYLLFVKQRKKETGKGETD